jgi:hypothetical protein
LSPVKTPIADDAFMETSSTWSGIPVALGVYMGINVATGVTASVDVSDKNRVPVGVTVFNCDISSGKV